MCILLCYTYATCPHVAKSGIYTCYAAKTSGRGFDEKCAKFKVTSQKLRWKKEPKRCGSCLETFGETAPIKRKRLLKVARKAGRDKGELEVKAEKEAEVKAESRRNDDDSSGSGSGSSEGAYKVKEGEKKVLKQVSKQTVKEAKVEEAKRFDGEDPKAEK